MKVWSFIILGLVCFVSFSQTQLTGIVKDNSGNPLVGAVATIKNTNSQAIIAYAITDELGGFSFQINLEKEELEIEIQSLGFKKWKKVLSKKNTHLDIVLQESVEQLKEVFLKSDPIRKRGDTIAYNVSTFKNQSDRTIADVIEKMPGLSILPSGQITYMGEPIEKYYIEGLDLMEGKYKLANESISVEDVARVEILENHQPIKVLDSLVGSQRTSINIKLKNNVGLSGKVEGGIGFSPGLLKTEITPFLLSKKRQTFTSYQYNNIGEDLSSYNSDFLPSQSNLPIFDDSKRNFLKIQQLQNPPFSNERWLNNKDHFGSANHLERLKKGLDLKVNLSYLNGTRKENGFQESIYKNASNNLNYFESIENTFRLHSLNTKITLEKNVKKNYFKNVFSSNNYWDKNHGFIKNNITSISQQALNPFWNLKNQFHILKPMGKQLLEFNSSVGYLNTSQELMVTPGVFIDYFNNGENYEKTHQFLNYHTFYTHNSIGFTKRIGVFTIVPTAGFSFIKEEFESDIITGVNNNPLTETTNDYGLRSFTTFLTNKFEYKDNIWRITLRTPLFLRNIESPEYNIASKPLTFEPDLFLSKKLTPFWETQFSGQISNSFGEAEDLHRGLILENYRSLTSNEPILSKQIQHRGSLALRYRNSLKGLFGSVSISLTKIKNNLLFDYRVSSNGAITIFSLEQDNNQVQNNMALNLSKYIDDWKTTLTGSSSFFVFKQDQIVNNVFDNYKTYGKQFAFKADIEANKWLTIGLNTQLKTSQLKSKDVSFERVKNWSNSLSTFFYLSKRQFLNADFEHFYNNLQSNQNTVFLNIQYQYSFKKHPIDVKLSWNNILNTKSYINMQNNEYYSLQSSYIIRPSQVFLTLLFTL